MDTVEHAPRKKVRQHPAALRQQVLMESAQPGASVARVAQSHGLNAEAGKALGRGARPRRRAPYGRLWWR